MWICPQCGTLECEDVTFFEKCVFCGEDVLDSDKPIMNEYFSVVIDNVFNAIKEWYDGESYYIVGTTDSHHGRKEDWDQSERFLNVYGTQQDGVSGDDYHGDVWFEYAESKFIHTKFRM